MSPSRVKARTRRTGSGATLTTEADDDLVAKLERDAYRVFRGIVA